MGNYLTLVISILVHLGIVTKAEGDKLSSELQNKTLPAEFEGAYQLVKEVFDKVGIDSKVIEKKVDS